MKWNVVIADTLVKVVAVEAASRDEAIEKVREADVNDRIPPMSWEEDFRESRMLTLGELNREDDARGGLLRIGGHYDRLDHMPDVADVELGKEEGDAGED